MVERLAMSYRRGIDDGGKCSCSWKTLGGDDDGREERWDNNTHPVSEVEGGRRNQGSMNPATLSNNKLMVVVLYQVYGGGGKITFGKSIT